MPLPPTKRRKFASSVSNIIRNFEQTVANAVAKNESLNPLADLVHLALHDAESVEECSKVIYALYRSFVLIFTNNEVLDGSDENSRTVKTWIWSQLNLYTDFLASLLQDEEKLLRVSGFYAMFSDLNAKFSIDLSTSNTLLSPKASLSLCLKIHIFSPIPYIPLQKDMFSIALMHTFHPSRTGPAGPPG